MQFGAFEPRAVQAKKLNELVKAIEELKAEVEALKGGKQVEEKPAKKASKVKAEESAE